MNGVLPHEGRKLHQIVPGRTGVYQTGSQTIQVCTCTAYPPQCSASMQSRLAGSHTSRPRQQSPDVHSCSHGTGFKPKDTARPGLIHPRTLTPSSNSLQLSLSAAAAEVDVQLSADAVCACCRTMPLAASLTRAPASWTPSTTARPSLASSRTAPGTSSTSPPR